MQSAPKRDSSAHGGVFLAALVAVALTMPSVCWPWHLLLPVLVYAAITLAVKPLRTTAPPVRIGRLGGYPLAFAVLLAITTSAVLVAFHSWVRPDVTELAGKLPANLFGNLILAGLAFSVVNAALEEVVFRGVLWGAIEGEWNPAVALMATSVLFGFGHLNGYPPGPVGAVLAGLYGLALGLLRWWTGGLGLAVGCHVCADATIFGLLLESGAFGQTLS